MATDNSSIVISKTNEPNSASSAWARLRPFMQNPFEYRFAFRISDASFCVAPSHIFSADPVTNVIVDAETGLSGPIILDPRDERLISGDFDQLPELSTLVGYNGRLNSDRCRGGGEKFGADGFAFVIQNSEQGSAALGCSGTGVGHSSNAKCQRSIANSVIVEFDVYYNVTEVRERGRERGGWWSLCC